MLATLNTSLEYAGLYSLHLVILLSISFCSCSSCYTTSGNIYCHTTTIVITVIIIVIIITLYLYSPCKY